MIDAGMVSLLVRGFLALATFFIVLAVIGALVEHLIGVPRERVEPPAFDVDRSGISNSAPYGTAPNIQARLTSDDSTAWPKFNWRPKFQELPRANSKDNSTRRNE